MLSLSDLEPQELGLPAKFTAFRQAQVEAIEQVVNSEKRMVGLCLPTGSGKSLVAMGAAKAGGLKTVILTATKGLQEQYLNDGRECGMVDVRGKANYPCGDCGDKALSCRFGALEGCRLTNGNGCTYETARQQAVASDLVVTNYDYWIRSNERRGTGKRWCEGVELLILDEGHAAESKLSSCIGVNLRESWLREAGYKFKVTDDLQAWSGWAAAHGDDIEADLKEAIDTYKRKRTKTARDRVYVLEELKSALGQIWNMTASSWVCEMRQGTQYGRVWDFDCVWPGQWAESRLFCGAPKIAIMSATLRPAAMGMLGLNKEQYEYREWDRVFPAQNTPVYHIPTVRMNHKTEGEDLEKWVERIDEIIESRLERKGIVHTVSYARQQYILGHSRFAARMLANTNDPDSESAAEVIESFKRESTATILVSPSFSTGWDFPGRDCEWQIIAKVPYPYAKTKVMQARLERNPRYSDYLAMQDMIQAAGRGTRSYDDRCEVFVVDDMVTWFIKKNAGLAPSWFRVNTVRNLPPPAPRAPMSKSLEPDWERGIVQVAAVSSEIEW